MSTQTCRTAGVNKPEDSPTTALVTGGTGLLGSHIAEQLSLRGTTVRALCRIGSDTTFLQTLNADIIYGDLFDREALAKACCGVDVVYHAAAKVGDWGPLSEFMRVSVDGTQNVLDAAANAGVRRFLHISSISVYGQVDGEDRIFDESAPLGVGLHRWSHYARAKIGAENRARAMHTSGRVVVTVIRPSWLYGPRDRTTLPRMIESIRRDRVKLIGDGENRLNVIHAGNVAEAAILAAQSDRAVGQVYNCSHDGVLTQRQYFNVVAKAIGEPQVTKSVPYRVAYTAGFVLECIGHLFRRKDPPLVTRHSVWLMGRRCFFECNRIKDHLGWSSSIGYEEGIPAAVADYLARTSPKTSSSTKRSIEACQAASQCCLPQITEQL